ncbi:MAG: hypothetical protein Q9170_007672 [Blastenia crenularia]
MSTGFVSGGTIDKPVERDDEWLKAQQEIEANRRRKEEEERQEGGKSLYEVLQNNKAAKQEAFEESIRLKNQFRTLDQDEVEFLDFVLESTRAKEDAIKKETTEQLELFRRQQDKADKVLLDNTTNRGSPSEASSPVNDAFSESSWAINARKRKRTKDTDAISAFKLRKSSSTSEKLPTGLAEPPSIGPPIDQAPVAYKSADREPSAAVSKLVETTQRSPSSPSIKGGNRSLGLVCYSSEEDE